MSDQRQPRQRPRKQPPRDWESAIDKAIREAQERGAFSGLPGAGKPLQWDDEHGPPEWRMANHILKNAGVAPSWIEDDKWIRAERKAIRELLASFVEWYRREVRALAGKSATDVTRITEELNLARGQRIQVYHERATKLNKRIDNFNLTVPVPSLQRPRVQIDEEISRFRQQLDEDQHRVIGG